MKIILIVTVNFSREMLKVLSSKLDTIPMSKIIDSISKVLLGIKPDIIYIPDRNDVHSDHAYVFDAMAACTKSFRYPFIKKVRVYETISETEFSITNSSNGFFPNLWVDISDYLDKKIDIVSIYESEIKPHPFPRSKKNIEALATFRGSTAGFKYAEAFVTLKEII